MYEIPIEDTDKVENKEMVIQTEYEFTLSKGYVDEQGNLHRNGVMRLATAADEILPLKEPKSPTKPCVLDRYCVVKGHNKTRRLDCSKYQDY